MRFIILVALLCSTVHSLNILITNTDHWVAKNSRYLKRYLEKHGHQVKLISSSEPNSDSLPVYSKDVTDYGPFEHLLPVHQSYYRKKQHLQSERPKNVMFKNDVHQSSQYGQDPLDTDCWYVNSNPLNTLEVGLNVILPQYHPDFTPDLVIIGPNEGIHNQYMVDTILKAVVDKNISAIAVSTEDSHDVYYLDETYFHVGGSYHHQLKKHNIVTKNIRFVNKQIGRLIKDLSNEGATVGLDVKIPSINHEESHCLTSHHSKLKMKKIESHNDGAVGYKFVFATEKDNGFVAITDVQMDVEKRQEEVREQEFFEMDNTEEEIVKGLFNCNVIVNIKYGKYNL